MTDHRRWSARCHRTTRSCRPPRGPDYLCLNGAKNEWNSLAGLCDLARLIDVCRLDWEAILARAARQRMSFIVSLGLCLAQDLLGSNLPPEVSSSIHADARA